jgi:vacuolar-type H+-ATPase subunit E/Vma4
VTTLAAPRAALEPLVEELLRRARHEAAGLVQEAEDEGRAARESARRQVEEEVRTATERGRAEGDALAEAELAGARRRSRARLLAAQAATHEEVGAAARRVVSEVLDRPGRRRRLEDLLRARLGESATVRPTADGGLEAVSDDGRSISASVAALAESAVDQLDLGELWTTS